MFFLPASPPPAPAVPDAPLTMLDMRESSAYNRRVQGFGFRQEGGRCTVSFHLADAETPWCVTAGKPWLDTLTGLVLQHGLLSWDGFSGSAGSLADGTAFSVHPAFGDGTSVSAQGYGVFPPGYQAAADAIRAHFLQLLPGTLKDW